MKKVLINRCYGGYGVSNEAIELWLKKKGMDYTTEVSQYGDVIYKVDDNIIWTMNREDSTLIEIFEEIGSERTSGNHAQLELVGLPDFCEYSIGEYDGQEWVQDTWINVTEQELSMGLSPEKLDMVRKVGSIRLVSEADHWDGDETDKIQY